MAQGIKALVFPMETLPGDLGHPRIFDPDVPADQAIIAAREYAEGQDLMELKQRWTHARAVAQRIGYVNTEVKIGSQD